MNNSIINNINDDIWWHIYCFLGYKESKNLLLNKTFYKNLMNNIKREKYCGKKIIGFCLKKAITWQTCIKKNDYGRMIVRTYENEMLQDYNINKAFPPLTDEQLTKLSPYMNGKKRKRRDMLNIVSHLTEEQISCIGF